MNKLEVGMYARIDGKIGKVLDICTCEQCEARGYYEPIIEYAHRERDYVSVYWKDNLKASHNIIDLIEERDILEINNEKYEVIYDESYEKLGILIPSRKELSIRHSALEYVFKKYNVSIVTHEMFKSISYEVSK